MQQGICCIFPQIVFIGLCVHPCKIIGKKQAVSSNLQSGMRIIRNDSGKQAVVLPKADAPAPDTLAVDHARSGNGKLDRARHGIFIKSIVITGKEEPCLSVRKFQAELQLGIRIGKNIPHDCIVSFMHLQPDPAQLPVLSDDAVMEIPDAVMHGDLLQLRAVVEGKSPDGMQGPGQ